MLNNDDYNIRSIPVLAVFLICIQSITQTVTVYVSKLLPLSRVPPNGI